MCYANIIAMHHELHQMFENVVALILNISKSMKELKRMVGAVANTNVIPKP